MSKITASLKTKSFRLGGYSIIAAVIVIVIAVFANILAEEIPLKYSKIDVTPDKIFTISEQTKQVAAGLTSDVNLYWVVREGFEDITVERLLDSYGDLSDKIHVIKKDPELFPTFIAQYTTTVNDNSVIVECGDFTRYLDYSQFYNYEYTEDYYVTGNYDVSFDGESILTSAINYVVTGKIDKVYCINGHGELPLADYIGEEIYNNNIQVSTISLMTDSIPDDAETLIINSPTSDISTQEKDLILAYLQKGGNLIVISNPSETDTFDNLYSVMSNYGVNMVDGIVVEGNVYNIAYDTPYYLLPDINYHSITSPLINNGYYVLLALAHGITIADDVRSTVNIVPLLTTSSYAYIKPNGYNITTFEKEEGDVDGPFNLAVAITEDVDANLGVQTQIVWFASGSIVDEYADQMVSGGNSDLFLNSLIWMSGQSEDNLAIHAKPLTNDTLTISSGTAGFLKVVILGIIPVGYLVIGILTVVKRRKK